MGNATAAKAKKHFVLFGFRGFTPGNEERSGFTLIELLVVISIIGLLASIVMASLNSARVKARDARRKSDLREIALALELFYDANGSYISTGATDVNNEYNTLDSAVLGGGGTYDWHRLDGLVTGGYISVLPVDPVNKDIGPWCWVRPDGGLKDYIYTYTSDGQHYILCTWMENTSDRDTLQFKDAPNPWNASERLYANRNYSPYSYVIVK
ncbi:prepilin-type N-terminal cleavage/methylation domain-containing protein [Candidatus Kaiserbacteria bacterium]|nr:prepilin-type N-terminal cleavage/methylation domain-containing protein [Candidatus Kaiserbacteria bacterium]